MAAKAASLGQHVGVGAAAVEKKPAPDGAVGGLQRPVGGWAEDAPLEVEPRPSLGQQAAQGLQHGLGVDDRGVRTMDGGHGVGRRGRLQFQQRPVVDALGPYGVVGGVSHKPLHGRQLVRGGGHQHLAGILPGDAVGIGKVFHGPAADGADLGFAGVAAIVQAAVQHAAVAAAGMASRGVFLFHHGHPSRRRAAEDFVSRGQADDAGSGDDVIEVQH